MKVKKTIKEKIAKGKAKIAEKLAAKVKAKKSGCSNCTPACIFAVVSLALAGCMETQPASRATTATYGDIIVKVGDDAKSNTVHISLGDGALASADSAGSTETQTATPTMDIKPDIDVAYNDAIKNATDASKGVLEKLTDSGAQAVLKMMSEKTSGTVTVPTKDGGSMVVKCENGQCAPCDDCTP